MVSKQRMVIVLTFVIFLAAAFLFNRKHPVAEALATDAGAVERTIDVVVVEVTPEDAGRVDASIDASIDASRDASCRREAGK